MAEGEKKYDYWDEMLATHRENGYLVILAVMLVVLNVCLVTVHFFWPQEDVYFLPGVEEMGRAGIAWSAPIPERATAVFTDIATTKKEVLVDLPNCIPDGSHESGRVSMTSTQGSIK